MRVFKPIWKACVLIGILYVKAFSFHGVLNAEDTKAMRLITTQSDRIASIGTIYLELSSEKWVEGKSLGRHRIVWGMTPLEEVFHFQQDQSTSKGEFSSLVFSLGNRSFYNGPTGFIGLQNFDGQLIDGVLPPDSPASAKLSARQAGIRVEDPWILLRQIIQFDDMKPCSLSEFIKEAIELRVISERAVMIKTPKHDFNIEFAENHLVRRIQRVSSGKLTLDAVVEEFKDVTNFGLFPWRVRATFKMPGTSELVTVVDVNKCRINENLESNVLSLVLPNEVPLFNAKTGQVGYWNNGEPHYFPSESEAKNWRKSKSLKFAKRQSSPTSPSFLIYMTLGLTIGIIVYLSWLRSRSGRDGR
jgi:hypothetical protein